MTEFSVIILLCYTIISGTSGVIMNGGLIALTFSQKRITYRLLLAIDRDEFHEFALLSQFGCHTN